MGSEVRAQVGRQVRCVRRGSGGSSGGVPLSLTSCSAPLLVVLHRDDEEDEQGDALDPGQEEEVVVERAVVDVPWQEETHRIVIDDVTTWDTGSQSRFSEDPEFDSKTRKTFSDSDVFFLRTNIYQTVCVCVCLRLPQG